MPVVTGGGRATHDCMDAGARATHGAVAEDAKAEAGIQSFPRHSGVTHKDDVHGRTSVTEDRDVVSDCGECHERAVSPE